MSWRVATRPGKKATLEVIDPEDWAAYSKAQQAAYEALSEFATEQEADKFAFDQVEAAKPVRPKLRPR
jgi:hypothetical protein